MLRGLHKNVSFIRGAPIVNIKIQIFGVVGDPLIPRVGNSIGTV